jgi:hypothetical protein
VALAAIFPAYFAGEKKGFAAGFEAGKAEPQTPAFIVETCSAWWWGSNRESTKMLKTYCEMKK